MRHSMFNLILLAVSSVVTATTYGMVQNFWTTIA